MYVDRRTLRAERASKKPCRKLKIAYTKTSPLGGELHPDAIKAVEETVKILESNGHRCEEAQPDVDGNLAADGFFMIYYAYMSAKVAAVTKEFGKKKARELLELDTQVLACIGNALNAGEFVGMRDQWNTVTRTMAAFFTNYDL